MPLTFGQLSRVHADVLRIFDWQPDGQTFGRIEHWDRPVLIDGRLKGDCDDFALECFYRLVEGGGTRQELRLAVARVDRNSIGPDHCVLLALDQYVLDNRFPAVRRIDLLPYDMWQLAPKSGPISGPWSNAQIA